MAASEVEDFFGCFHDLFILAAYFDSFRVFFAPTIVNGSRTQQTGDDYLEEEKGEGCLMHK